MKEVWLLWEINYDERLEVLDSIYETRELAEKAMKKIHKEEMVIEKWPVID